ncbi:hypothetical protein GH714_040592 [Hevea brasiliensis]|uniref:Pentacotripeptide-repeat region of PRORP domain-containing protein n=1 Tax=Hevea brasiliensis TaxID=3981 RepID=A0A6A6KYS5_HEVBR|nr:hypothetical protein GH714_040592 [Hevea brasiliensis]
MQVARDLPENSTLGEQLSAFEGRISATECLEVLGLMGDVGMMTCCLYFFEWMRLQEPSLVTPRACTVLFPILGRAGMGDKLMILFRNLPQNKDLEMFMFTMLLFLAFSVAKVISNAYLGCPVSVSKDETTSKHSCVQKLYIFSIFWYDDACKVYETMEANGISPDHVTCSIMITVMRKMARSAKEAWEFFERMNRKGVKWSPEVLGALIKSFCDEGLKNEALIIQVEMARKGISSNVIVYNTLMDAFNKSNQIEEVEGLFTEMKVSGWHEKAYIAFEHMQREGVKPSVETYTALLDAFRRAGDAQMLMKIWKLMIREKVEGTRVTFNILLDGFAKQGHYVEARDVISEFGKFGLQPTVITYNMLMNAYGRGGQHSKLPQLLKEMAALDLKPDSVTYLTMIYAFIRVRDFRRAFFYHKKMVKSGQVPDAKSYQKLRALLEVKAKVKNRRDRSAILGIINSRMGLLKVKKKGKKDEFWKHKKRDPRMIPRMHNADHESR